MSDRYFRLRDKIDAIAKECGRNPEEIILLAVSKGHPWEKAQSVYEAGCRDFGENRVKEALEKIAQAPSDIHWHFIGSLQSKKIRQVVGNFSLIHSVDSLKIAEKISEVSKETGVTTKILLQANTSGELSKHGLTQQQWKEQFPFLIQLPFIQVEGLMTMAPLTEDKLIIKNCFDGLRKLRDELRELSQNKCPLPHLSMGMSHDYPVAIAAGATILRIGTAIFGIQEEDYRDKFAEGIHQ